MNCLSHIHLSIMKHMLEESTVIYFVIEGNINSFANCSSVMQSVSNI